MQQSFLRFTPQYYEEKIKSLESEIQTLKKEFDKLAPGLWGTQFNLPGSRDLMDRFNRVQDTLQKKTIELEKLQAEYQQKFPFRPKPNMMQE